eukprot:TRINITY_DN225_c0_g1_i1.p1 TRINITY_DN225_c0_g1~~TRINITY_DN225_c0_g1_i1.p1  ORF type:complete len:1030 (+),score=418.93 TRINITY_DN225_c0_g1_i1:222-3092(+)
MTEHEGEPTERELALQTKLKDLKAKSKALFAKVQEEHTATEQELRAELDAAKQQLADAQSKAHEAEAGGFGDDDGWGNGGNDAAVTELEQELSDVRSQKEELEAKLQQVKAKSKALFAELEEEHRAKEEHFGKLAEELQAELADAKEQLIEAQTKHVEKDAAVADMEQQLATVTDRSSSLEAELADAKQCLADAQSQLHEVEAVGHGGDDGWGNAGNDEAVEELKQQLSDVGDELARAKERCSALEGELGEAASAKEELEAKLQQVKTKSKALFAELEEEHRAKEEHFGKLAEELQAELADAKQQLIDAQTKLQEAEAGGEDGGWGNEGNDTAVAELEQQLSDVRSELAASTERCAALEGELGEAKAASAVAPDSPASPMQGTGEPTERELALQAKLKDVKAKSKALFAEMQEEVNGLREEEGRWGEERVRLEGALADMRGMLEMRDEDVAERDALEMEVEALRGSINDWRQGLKQASQGGGAGAQEELMGDLRETTQERDELAARLKDMKLANEELIQKLSNTLEESNERRAALERDMATLKTALEAAEADAASARAACEAQEEAASRLGAQVEMHAGLQGINDSLTQQVAAAQEELAALHEDHEKFRKVNKMALQMREKEVAAAKADVARLQKAQDEGENERSSEHVRELLRNIEDLKALSRSQADELELATRHQQAELDAVRQDAEGHKRLHEAEMNERLAAQKEQQYQALQQLKAVHEVDLVNMEFEVEEARTAARTEEAAKEASEAELKELRDEAGRLRGELNKARATAMREQALHDEELARVKADDSKVAAERAAREDEHKAWEEERAELVAETKAAAEKYLEIQRQVDSSAVNNETESRKLKDLQAAIADLKDKVKGKEDEVAQLEAAVTKKDAEMQAVNAKIIDTTNDVYLKQVVVQFLTGGADVRSTVIPILVQLLGLTAAQAKEIYRLNPPPQAGSAAALGGYSLW